MRAWVSGNEPGLAYLTLKTCDPPIPADGELLVRVRYSALNFSDQLMIDDQYQVRPARPFVPGQEIAGIVEQAGSDSRFRPGDQVVSKVDWGGFADYVCVRESMAIRVDAGSDEDELLIKSLALPVSYMTASVALTHCSKVKAGDTVLVLAAAGGVGLACVELASALGARVIACAGDADKLALAKRHGAVDVVNYGDTDWVRQVRQLTDRVGANIIVDPVGGTIGESSLHCIAREGTLLIVGFASGTFPQLAANRLLLKRASAKGVYWSHETDGEMLVVLANTLSRQLAAGVIRPVVDCHYEMEDLPLALSRLTSRQTKGKLALRIAS